MLRWPRYFYCHKLVKVTKNRTHICKWVYLLFQYEFCHHLLVQNDCMTLLIQINFTITHSDIPDIHFLPNTCIKLPQPSVILRPCHIFHGLMTWLSLMSIVEFSSISDKHLKSNMTVSFLLTLKAPITSTNHNCCRLHFFFFFFFFFIIFQEKCFKFCENHLTNRLFTWNIKSLFAVKHILKNYNVVC